MKGFIKKIIIFLLLSILSIVVLILGSNYIVKTKATFEIDKNITRLIIGHSHSQCAINDSILNNSINLSASGESYFYNYQKLKKVVGDNQQINTVFIEFANNHVDSIMDDWTWGFEKMSYYLPFYSAFMETEDFNVLLDNNSTDVLASYSIATRKHLYRLFKSDYNFIDEIGGFTQSRLSKVDELIAKGDFNSSISKSQSTSSTNINYLRKMIDLCRENNIAVFLIRSPQHPKYADLRNEAVYKNVLNEKFSDVSLLDFDDMFFPNNEYLDLHHLNYKGANRFTTVLNELIENNLLKSVNQQLKVNKAIADFNKE